MKRREFIALAGSMAVWPLAARAEQRMPVIGFVAGATLKGAGRYLASVRNGLAEYGYVEGQNVRFESREANYQYDLLPILYRELVNQKVSVILVDSTLKLELAKAATQSIPIVFEIGVDPVENGFVASLNKPGGNITGTFNFTVTLGTKQLEIIHELVPIATKFAHLKDPGNTTNSKLVTAHLEAAADSLGLGLLDVSAHTGQEFEAAFETAVRGGAGGMIVGADPLFVIGFAQLVAIAARYRLPTIYFDDQPVKAGGLVSYSSDKDEDHRVQGRYVGRILKGEKPADIPVMQATKTILAINLKTAKALAITVPISLLGRADEVIE
jgi:putative tryptophan/tyrosine transport system substrate-binding protein